MSKITLRMSAVPAAISQSVADVLGVHGLSLSPELLREIGKNAAQVLVGLDLALDADVDEPAVADRLSVGETLRALAAAGRPNPSTAETFARVGTWLAACARAELEAERDDRDAMRDAIVAPSASGAV